MRILSLTDSQKPLRISDSILRDPQVPDLRIFSESQSPLTSLLLTNGCVTKMTIKTGFCNVLQGMGLLRHKFLKGRVTCINLYRVTRYDLAHTSLYVTRSACEVIKRLKARF